MKWTQADYKSRFQRWTPPPLVYPCEPSEKDALHALKNAFQPLPPYKLQEQRAIEQNTQVTLDIPITSGQIAFLENTAEQCTSPQTKHSQEGMQGARHWVQRVDTPSGMFRRLTDGYGISLMFGERCHQYIRNSNNYRGNIGCMLDLDVWYEQPETIEKKLEADDRDADFIAKRLAENEKLPKPVFSMQELFNRYPLLPRICSFILPSASSLYEGRPFKARGVILFPEPITDQRVYRAFGDILCSELDCIPPNVTKNPVAVGFGNTHNATDAFKNASVDRHYIAENIERATASVLSTSKKRKREQKKKAERAEHYRKNGGGEGENISDFISKCDPVSEMVRAGLLTPGRGNNYRWHESQSETDRSCDILDGTIHIFSHSLSAASPAAENEPVGVHRFYLYQLCGLDMTRDADKPRIREFLFDRGYGSDPKTFAKKQHKDCIRKPVKLQKNIVSMLTETLDASRAFLKSVFENQKIKFFGLRADTGVGKNEGAIHYYLRGFRGLINVPTTDLAKELEARLNAAEVAGVFRYRGILSNPDGTFPDENPCIHAERYDAIASRGWNAYELLCERCPVRAVCEEHGYRSQAERAKQAQVIVMPFPDIFLNPAFRHIAKDFLPTYHDDLILHDEFDPYNAFLEINLPKSRLIQLRDDWKGYDPSQFAKEVLRILEVEGDLSLLRPLISELTDAERESILEGVTCVMWKGQILSREDAHRCHEYVTASRSLDGIQTLPRLETEDWNLLVQLELFFQRYPRDADMPMKYENDTLTFLLPPLPMKTRARMGFMSATLNETFFRRAMDNRQIKRGDVSFHETGLTALHPEARVYQLRTNRNPRATAYNAKGERVNGDLLSATGDFYWQLVADDLQKPNRGLITYKALLENKADELTWIHHKAGGDKEIPVANFGGLVGLDTHFKDVSVLHVLFSPEIPPSAVGFKVKALFGNDTEPLNFARDENGQYTDTRTQMCYDAGVISELQQAIGRGRLVSKPIKVVVWCSHFLPGITDREQTHLFDEVDWEQAEGDLEKLAAVVKAREAAEQHGDVKAYAQTTGQSQRTAYRQTAQARKQSQAARDAEFLQRILELKDKGNLSDNKIATQLGISRGRLQSLMRKHTAA